MVSRTITEVEISYYQVTPPSFPNLGNNYSEKFIINFYLIEFNVFNIYMYVLQITSSVLAGVLDEIKTLEKTHDLQNPIGLLIRTRLLKPLQGTLWQLKSLL